MRQIKTHEVTDLDTKVRVEVMDDFDEQEVKTGKSHSHYQLSLTQGDHSQKVADLKFQKAVAKDDLNKPSVNGITNEALLAVVIDRLEAFQKGPYPCKENEYALMHCYDAIFWLQSRTRDRVRREVYHRLTK